MATVTGFTAERMLQIENTTVVDGDVVGDNLILLQRDGTQIDAGSVRGPQGIQGIPGPVSSINDQTGFAYAPRFFDSKVQLDAQWPVAPNGTQAFTIAEQCMWYRQNGAWSAGPPVRIFPTKSALDTAMPVAGAMDGALAMTLDARSLWQKDSSGWVVTNGIRVFATKEELVSRWGNAPNGSVAEAPVGVYWMMFGSGHWVARPVGTSLSFDEKHFSAAGTWVDQQITWTVGDGVVWPVDSIATCIINTDTSCWTAGFIPKIDLWSDSFSSPYIPGFGMPYASSQGLPAAANNVGPLFQPQALPAVSGVQLVPATKGINWSFRITVHNSAGSINWSGGYKIVMKREPFHNL